MKYLLRQIFTSSSDFFELCSITYILIIFLDFWLCLLSKKPSTCPWSVISRLNSVWVQVLEQIICYLSGQKFALESGKDKRFSCMSGTQWDKVVCASFEQELLLIRESYTGIDFIHRRRWKRDKEDWRERENENEWEKRDIHLLLEVLRKVVGVGWKQCLAKNKKPMTDIP